MVHRSARACRVPGAGVALPRIASGPVDGDGDRQGLRSGCRDRRMERTAPASSRAAVPSNPLTPVRPCHLLPGRDAHVREADLRPGRRNDPRRTDRRPQRRRQTDRRDRDRDGRRHDCRPPRRPRTGVCPAVLIRQGSRQHARLHGRERAERRLRHRRTAASSMRSSPKAGP